MMTTRLLLLCAAALLLLLLVATIPPTLAADEPKKAEGWRDHTLNQAGPSCIAEFYRIAADNYPPGDPCEAPVQQSFAAVNKEACPGNMTLVQQCLGKTSTSADAFTALVARCPVLNVRARDPAQPPVDTSHFSCFGVFDDPEAFRAYANGTASAPKGSYAAQNGAGGGRGLGGMVGVGVAALAVAVGGLVVG